MITSKHLTACGICVCNSALSGTCVRDSVFSLQSTNMTWRWYVDSCFRYEYSEMYNNIVSDQSFGMIYSEENDLTKTNLSLLFLLRNSLQDQITQFPGNKAHV